VGGYNPGFGMLDAVVNLFVLSAAMGTPPLLPANGDRYIVNGVGSGAWAGHPFAVAVYRSGGWVFYDPKPGWQAFDASTAAQLLYSGSAWVGISDFSVGNVRSYGAVGDGVTDDTAAFAATAAAVPSTGGLLLVPPGNYSINATIFLKSGTTLSMYGATITPAATWTNPAFAPGPTGIVPGKQVFCNENWDAAVPTDHDIQILGGTFQNGSADPATPGGRKAAYQFGYVERGLTENVTVFGGGGSFAHPGCTDWEVRGCKLFLIGNSGIDFWNGFSNIRIVGNFVSANPTYAQGPLIQITGSNSDNSEGHSRGAIVLGNETHGAGANVYSIAGTESGGALSTLSDVVISNNIVEMDGYPGSGGIGIYGGGTNRTIVGNRISNVSDYVGLSVFPNGYGTPVRAHVANNSLYNCTRTSGGATLVSIEGNDNTVIDNDLIDCTYTVPLSVLGARCVVRSGSMKSGGAGSRGTVTGTGSHYLDFDPDADRARFTKLVSSEIGFQIGSGNTLATYIEAGAWTPVLIFGGASVGIIYSNQVGIYYRVGKLVYITCAMTLTSKGSSVGNAQITGLPYSIGAASNFTRLAINTQSNFIGLTEDLAIRISSQTLTIAADVRGGANATNANFANNSVLAFVGWYHVQ
jgi:hypothetical protein